MEQQTEYFNIENYFADQQTYCGSFFDRAIRNGKKAVYARYGQARGEELLKEARKEYEDLLPRVPYVGEIDLLKRQMLLTVIFTAFYRLLKDQESLDDIWTLCESFNRETLMGMPGLVRWLLKKSTFGKKMRSEFEKQASEHKQRNLADQWDFVKGDGKSFDYGMNMTRCAKVIFLQDIGAGEFAPYVCLIDKNFARCCSYGLKRTQVLAEGAPYCDFRLSKNGEIDVRSAVS